MDISPTPQEARKLKKILSNWPEPMGKNHQVSVINTGDLKALLKAAGRLLALHDAGEWERWCDISSAPTDDVIVLTDGGMICQGFFQDGVWLTGWSSDPVKITLRFFPTHWRPLPKPPQPVSDTDKLPEKNGEDD